MIRRGRRRAKKNAQGGGAGQAAAGGGNAPAVSRSLNPTFTVAGSNKTQLETDRAFTVAGIPQNWRLHVVGNPVLGVVTRVSQGSPTFAGITWSINGVDAVGTFITIEQRDPGLRGVRGGHIESGKFGIQPA